MTSLAKRKSKLRFETEDCKRERGKLRQVCFEFDTSGYTALVRLKGMRQGFPITPSEVYDLAVKKFVLAQKAEKARKK